MLHRRAFQGWQAEGHPNLRAEGGAESAHRTAEGGISRGDSSWPQRVRRQGLPLLQCEGGVWLTDRERIAFPISFYNLSLQ